MVFIQPPRQLIGTVAGEADAGQATSAAIAALMQGGRHVLEATAVKMLNAA